MTIATELTKLETNLSNAYEALENKGATISGNKNFDNLSIDVESIPGLDGLGRELRAAYAYTCTTPAQGKHTFAIYNNNILYESPLYDDLNPSANRFVSEGKLYTATISNSEMVITQQGTNEDWIFSETNSFGIRNNKLLPTSLSSEELISYSPRTFYGTFNDTSLIFNGKLYSSSRLLDDTGIWTKTYAYTGPYYMGLRDGYFTTYAQGNLYIYYDIKVKGDLITWGGSTTNGYVIDTNLNLQKLTFSSSTNTYTIKNFLTLEKNPIKMIFNDVNGNHIIILYDDNTVEDYAMGSSYNLSATYTNCKDILPPNFILYNNGDLYTKNTFIKNIGENGTIFAYNTSATSSGFRISYTDNVSLYDTVYVPSVIENTAYYNVDIQSSQRTIASKTNTSLTIGDKTYIRDASKDSYFTFVPEELANHTFSDQEICQAALVAGL